MPGKAFTVFFEAMCRPPPRVLGRQLLPFSLGHLFLLRGLNSPYAIGGVPLFSDFVPAVFICSNNWADNVRTLMAGNVPGKDIIKWGRTQRKADLAQAQGIFRDYLAAAFTAPEAIETKGGHETGAPFELHLVYFLVTVMRLPLALAWDFPFAQANAWHELHVERQRLAKGEESQLLTDQQIELLEMARTIREAAARADAMAKDTPPTGNPPEAAP